MHHFTGGLFNTACSNIGYVVNCNQNTEKLRAELENLRAEMETVRGRVNRARDNAEEIEPNVSKWLSDAGDMVNQTDQFLAADGEWVRGASIVKRRRLGKEAEDKLMDVVNLIERGKFDSVGYRPTLSDIRLLKSTADYYQGFESRAEVFDEIMQALGDDNVYTIGMYGMAGIGKTTMARAVAKQAKDKNSFDKIVLVSISQNPDLKKVQGELADFLGLKLDKESLAGRASLLCARFKQKPEEKILVILDDVWGQINIEEVGIPLNNYVKGCKIVVTSRTQGVLVGEEVGAEKECQLGVLTDAEAWCLFENKVGNTIDSHHQELRSVVEEVCRECGGLPLAIVTLGAALNGKKPHQWIDTLVQLKSCTAEYIDGMTAKVYLPIQLSYEFLQHRDTKACFLFCCLYPEDAEISIEELMWYGVGARFIRNRDTMEAARARVSTIVDGLKASCLLLEGRDENSVKMHDIIRDVAISIASKDTQLMLLVKIGVQKWPDEEELKWCRTLSLMLEKDEALPNQLECPELRTLVLECGNRNLVGGLDGFFKTTRKLEVLCLHNVILSPTIGSSISNLANLRMLCLHGCKLENIGFVAELKKLEILSLNGSMIAALSPEVRKLSHLKVLDFRRCDYFHEISPGIISSLSDLEELYASDMSCEIGFCGWDEEGNASIGELNSLQHLTNLEAYIPEKVWSSQDLQCVSSLIRYKICIGCHFGTFENYAETRALKFRGIKLIGGAQVLTKKAQALYLNDPKGLQDWLRYMDGEWFLDLKFLNIENCEDEMEHLLGEPKWIIPSPISSASPLCKLSKLTVSNCRLKSLFSASVIRCLPQLQKLGVKHCESMVEIVGGDKEVGDEVLLAFPRLKKLKLWSLPNLKSFYGITTTQALFNGKVSFPVLHDLIIEDLQSITAIWDHQWKAQDSLQQLSTLTVGGCNKLEHLFASHVLPFSQSLKTLEVHGCDSVKFLFGKDYKANDEILVFTRLEDVAFSYLPSLKSFCYTCTFDSHVEDMPSVQALFTHEVSFPVLHDLIIEDLQSITAIWDHQWKAQDFLQQLSKLRVGGCDKLEHLFASHVLRFSESLKSLQVHGCDSVKFLFGKDCKANDEILVFTELEDVELSNLPSLKSFCYTCTFDSHVEDMPSVQALFTHEVSFPVLHDLIIEDLQSITAIWDHQWKAQDSLQQLSTLTVGGCNKLEHLLASHVLRFSQSLKTLKVHGCDSVKSLFGKDCKANNEILIFTELEDVELSNLPSLKSFCYTCTFDSHMEDMPSVQALFTHEVLFPVLHDLIIEDLQSITAIWDHQRKAQDSLQQLSKLRVRGCDKLEHLFASHVLPFSQSLKSLEVHGCDSVKFLFGKDCKANDEILIFTELKDVELSNLPSLKNFCYTCTFDSHVEDMPSVQALFTHEVSFPVLHDLIIDDLQSITAIWDHQWKAQDSLQQLSTLTVGGCNKLEHLFASHVLPFSQSLKTLKVHGCDSVKFLFGKDCKANNEIFVFTVLEDVELSNLPSLKSFCYTCTFDSHVEDMPSVQALFTHEVSFPVLHDLIIEDLQSITAIWDHQWKAQDSLQQLSKLRVRGCDKLEHLFASHVLPFSRSMKSLEVHGCDSLKFIFGKDCKANDEILVFTELEDVELSNLPSLKSFCYTCTFDNHVEDMPSVQALFTHEVSFPVLYNLIIEDLQSITAIWDHQWKAQDSLQQLSILTVGGCNKLEHLFASHVLPFSQSLKSLEVHGCDLVKFLFEKNCKANDEILVFTELDDVELSNLPSLKSFCYTCTFDSHVEDMPPVQALFTHEVKLPRLKWLNIESVPSLKGIWDITVPTDSICKLEWLFVTDCRKLLHVAPSKLLKGFHEIRHLSVKECNLLEDIFRVEDSNSAVEIAPVEMKNELVLPQLEIVSLINLPSLTSFYSRSCISKLMPSSVQLEIESCPKLEKELAMHTGDDKEQ